MNPYIKIIRSAQDDKLVDFVKDPFGTFKSLSILDKGIFLVRQAFLYNYIERLCDRKPDPLIKQYGEYLQQLYYKFKSEFATSIDRNLEEIQNVPKLYEYLTEWRESSYRITKEDLLPYLETSNADERIPSAGNPSFYVPYSHYITSTQAVKDLSIGNGIGEQFDFTYEQIDLPLISIVSDVVLFDYTTFGKYEFNASSMTSVKHPNEFADSYFGWLACVKPRSEVSFGGYVAFLAGQVWDLDASSTESCTQKKLISLFEEMFAWKDVAKHEPQHPMKSASFDEYVFTPFLFQLRTRWDVQFDDPKLLASVLEDCVMADEDRDKLVNYLRKVDRTPVTMEEYSAFKNSAFGQFTELDQNTFQSLEAEEDELDEEEEFPVPTDAGGEEDADENPEDTTEETPEENTEETPEEDVFDEEETDEETPEETGTEDEPNTNESTNDSKGVEFILSKGENLDTILYRMELSEKIDEALENPNLERPKQILLRKIKTYWMNLLSVQTIESVLALAKVKKA